MIITLKYYRCPSWNKVMRAHFKKQEEMANYAYQSIMEALSTEKWEPFTEKVEVRVFAYSPQPTDSDNICCKFLIDALRFYGVIKNDTRAEVKRTISEPRIAKNNFTEIVIDKV